MTDVTTAPAPEPTQPEAGTGEPSVTRNNMLNLSAAPKLEGAPVDRKAKVEELAKHIQSTIPLTMSDEDALQVGREVEDRYLPPAPAPSVLELIEEAKKKAAEAPAT